MDFAALLSDLLYSYTLRTVALGAGVLGVVSGSLGSFAVLRRQSLLGDAMSHAALPGIVIAFILTRSKLSIVLLLGAAITGWVAALVMGNVVRHTRIKQDSALALVLSVFFGFGLMLLTFVQRIPDATQAGLNTYLFGQAAALLQRDVITMAVLGGVALILMTIFWKEFKLLSFDPDFGASLGFPMRLIDILLTTTLVIAIVVGLQAVGVVLMSAMIVAPAAAARQWTDRLGLMVLLAALFGALSGVIGAIISSSGAGLATGPTIVLTISAIVVISLFLAPNRGLVWSWVRQLRNRRRLRVDAVLADLYTLAAQHEDKEHAHDLAVLRAMSASAGGVERTLQRLQERGLVQQKGDDQWALTQTGLVQARQLVDELEI
ncbi:MAG TPA: metal ABC transporter permease [Candidatus Sulfomarinibacteraceae bacterium]|nr:metal ABC transporter permease [Candidatus Sulfomarinibacteraceae bacterium]